MTPEKEIFTIEEAAQMMGCAPSTIEEHARARVLPGVRMGHEWRFPREAFMKANFSFIDQSVASLLPNALPDPVTWQAIFTRQRTFANPRESQDVHRTPTSS